MLFFYTHIQGTKADRFCWSAVSSFRGGMIPVLLGPRLEFTCTGFLWSYMIEVCGSSWGESQAKADTLT